MATGRIGVTPTLRTRWSKAPAGGTTSLSGLDDNSVSLVYDVGYEGVYRNGVLLSRGNDYTATDGTTVTLIDATIAGDIIEIFANELIPLSDAISKGQYTAKGALLSATAASTPGVLTVGSNNQVLTADSSTSTGLKWATPASGGMTLINTGGTALNTTSTVISSIPSGYNSLRIITVVTDPQDDGGGLRLRINEDSTANRHAQGFFGGSISNIQFNQTSIPITFSQDNGTPNGISITDIVFYDNTSIWKFATNFAVVNSYLDNARAEFIQTFGAYNQTGAVTSLEFFFNAMNASGGTVYVYGVK